MIKEMKKFTVGCSPITNTIFCGTVSDKGVWAKDRKDVTDSATGAVAQHLLQLDQRIEFDYKGEQYVLKVEKIQQKTQPPLIRLTEMSGDHFEQIFHEVGFAPAFKKELIGKFNSLHGFHLAISNYGTFVSHRKAVELGYDVEFTLDIQP